MIRIISRNINGQTSIWDHLQRFGADIALLQEAREPPPSAAGSFEVESNEPWRTEGAGLNRPWRTAVVKLSGRVQLTGRSLKPIEEARPGELAVSRRGTLAIGDVANLETGETLTVGSLYGVWEKPDAHARGFWIYADASVHRLISDLSALIARQRGHRIIVAGDLNVLLGYGEEGSDYWRMRYESIFLRMEALGLSFVGPQAPDGGIQASPWPNELPRASKNVPTFRTKRDDPGSATRQLDFVFASADLRPRPQVRALNRPDEWGPSDHCPILIELV